MKRKIEFRALTNTTKGQKWVYGYPYKENFNWYIRNDHIIDTIIDESTLGQYTGLKDKNGKKIFEGDILKAPMWLYGEETTCVCIYNQENNVYPIIGFGLYMNNGYFSKYQDIVDNDEWDEFEVVGNIYEDNLESEVN